MMNEFGDPPIPISLISHTQFCPRRAWLEAAGERTDTYQMAAGTIAHERVDDPSTSRAVQLRSIETGHAGWGVTGRIDALYETQSGYVIREHKATPVSRSPTVTDAMRIQLALQQACLESEGHTVAGTEIYFSSHNKVVPIELADEDFVAAQELVEETRRIISSETAPQPLEDSPKCMRCSHASVCLPEERRLAEVRRRIVPAAPDSQIVHLTRYGARASISKRRLTVKYRDELLADVPIERVLGVQVHGNIDLSSALIRELLWRDRTIVWCSGGGRVIGWSQPARGPNGLQRVRQHVASAEGRLGIAREMLQAKVANQATQLRRGAGYSDAVDHLRAIQAELASSESWPAMIGLEGEAAAVYFSAWHKLFKVDLTGEWGWLNRGSRPARDPVNALLNYTYGMLAADTIRAVISCGLDPHAGFIHSSNRNKPALALDLMEEFRAPIADSVVISVINNGEVSLKDFDARLGSVRLSDRARKSLISAYERRVQTEFRHPLFNYSVTWRRAMEVQARQVLGVLDGSQPRYAGIRTR